MRTEIDRRRFLAKLAGSVSALWALMLAVPGIGFLLTPITRGARGTDRWVHLNLPDIVPTDRPIRIDFAADLEDGWMQREAKGFAYAVREGADLVVFSPICTHLGCKVSWSDSKQRFLCPCHGGQYDLSGRVVAGPPPAPLNRLSMRTVDDRVQIEVTSIA